MKSLLTTFLITTILYSCGNNTISQQNRNKGTADTIKCIKKDLLKAYIFTVRDGRFLDTIIVGNFDLDEKRDTAFLWVPMDPKREFRMFGCRPCDSEISFSNHLPSLLRKSDIGGMLENAGDLDGDGIDELAYDDAWFTGCWGVLELYKVKDKRWQEAGAIKYHACSEEKRILKRHIKKLKNGHVKLIGDDPTFSYKTEIIYDLKADSLPCIIWVKEIEE